LLPLFPSPYEDEILYSILGRYHVWSFSSSYKNTLLQLFGRKSGCAVISFPSHLDDLIEALSSKTILTVERLINQHTMFPLFRPFLPSDRAEQIIRNMAGNQGKGIYHLVGAMASSIPTLKYLRYCRECVKADLRDFGEAYWHRVHQVPCVTTCPKHSCRLSDSSVCISPPNNKTIFYPVPTDAISDNLRKPETLRFPHTDIAKAVQWLLENNTPVLGLETLLKRYTILLQKKDLATFRGRVRQQEVAEAINAFYSSAFLHEVYCPVDKTCSDNWLASLLRKPRKASHPLRHILLLIFLETTPEHFLCGSFSKTSPFGYAPWPCLNPACNHYRRDVIQKCNISRDKTGSPVGTFSCQCGFIYARRGPDIDPESRFKIGRIKAFGEKWHQKLLSFLIEKQCSLREMARRLNVDPQTVKHQLSVCLARKVLLSKKNEDKVKCNSYRSQLLILIRLFPDKSRTEIRNMIPGVYTWLYRHDKVWLLSNLPPALRKHTSSKARVNWDVRDEEIFILIQNAAEIIKTRDPLVRVSISSIGKQIGCLSFLQRHLEKLPRTQQVIRMVVETIEEFQDRRIIHAVLKMKSEGVNPVTWKIMRYAGLKKGAEKKVESFLRCKVQYVETEFTQKASNRRSDNSGLDF
jgi:hypothetical protein